MSYICSIMNILKNLIASICICTGLSLHAQPVSLQQSIEALASDPTFSEALVGVCIRTADGQPLVDINSEKKLLPASNMKLISTGAALHSLGSDYRFETVLGYSGEIEEGTLHGDLYIVGGGDPTLGSKDSIAVVIDTTFAQWKAIISKAGIERIEGRIVGDGRWFEGMAEAPSWLLEDAGTYYGTGVTGLMFYENMQSFSVSAGTEVGAPVNIEPSYPEAPWMYFRYNCTTGEAGTGDRLFLHANDLAPVAEIRGTFGVDRAAKRLDCANKFPEYTCAYYFHNYLKDNGITCTGGPTDVRMDINWEPVALEQLNILGATQSPTLERIAYETNHASNNLYAETLFRTLGKELCDCASYDSAYVAVNDIMKAMGMDTAKGASIKDGSGLSRQDYVSADFFCDFLESMTESPEFEAFLRSLPSPGGNGTLEYNMAGYSASIRNRIKAKSGSMNGVRCYSGYILPSNPEGQTLIFSIMTNNCTEPVWKVRPLLDKMMAAAAATN